MLPTFETLFNSLKANKIIFCCWKGHSEKELALLGEGDLDIFVPNDFKFEFEKVAKNAGFVKVFSYQANHPFLEHYYGFDKEKLQFIHLHVYFKIVTGEHISKNYILPLENFIIDNIDHSSLLPEVKLNAATNIFLLRYFLKVGSLFGLYQYSRERSKYVNEADYLDLREKISGIQEIGFSQEIFDQMKETYKSASLMKKYFLSLNIKKKLKDFRRRSFFDLHFYNFRNSILRLFNKIFFRKNKLFETGYVFAICGIDGSGKSSLVSGLKDTFSKDFSVKVFHLGRPSSSIISFVFKPFLKTFSILRRYKKDKIIKKDLTDSRNVSLAFILRSLMLAYDRKRESSRAHNFSRQGYIVFCDRYPGILDGKMDSPRIPLKKGRSKFYQFCYQLEKDLYQSIELADVIFQIKVPLEVSLKRNETRNKIGKETEEELKNRFELNSEATFLSKKIEFVDGVLPFTEVLSTVSGLIWSFNFLSKD